MRVWAYHEQLGTTGIYPVLRVFTNPHATVVVVRIGGELIHTSEEHPFFTLDRGWVPAAQLTPGDRVRRLDGSSGVVESVTIETRDQVMLNLEVDDAHTFLIGAGQWLVHKANECTRASVDQLIEMANKRTDTVAANAEGDQLAYLQKMEAEGTGWVTEAGGYEISLAPDKAGRATVFHEWLHRYRRQDDLELESQAAEERVIEGFLRRHRDHFGLTEEDSINKYG